MSANPELLKTPEPRDWDAIRADFPVLDQKVHDKRLAYLDSAASSQMPQQVIDAIVEYQSKHHSNIHRGVHALSQRATDLFEDSREKVRGFLNASETAECIFTRGATEAINLVAHGFGRKFLKEGDQVVITTMEHHSNIVPWQMLREERGIELVVVPMTDDGRIEPDAFEAAFTERTKLAACIHVSNALGTINPIGRFAEIAHGHDVPILVDGCQAAPHMTLDVQELDVDFYALSAHKMCGSTGCGVLYGKREWLEKMNPFLGGGDMILSVTFEKTEYNVIPHKFEAGTPPILPVIALGAAIDYLNDIGRDHIAAREHELLAYAMPKLAAIDGFKVYGPEAMKTSVISFGIGDVHPHDIGTILDQAGVAIRAGHHCTQPLMKRLGIPATARASLAFYNNHEDVDQLVEAVKDVKEIFG